MGQTIEAFVEKIKTDGIEAGQEQAEGLIADAQKQAESTIAEAEKRKESIISAGQAEAASLLERAGTELELAARDAALRLRDALNATLRAVLAHASKGKLGDVEFIGSVLHEIITQYAKAELEGGQKRLFKVDVPEEMREQLVEWALAHLGQDTIDGEHMAIDLKGTLSQVGFEYNITGATVEVTLESVVEVLGELVGPSLREVIAKAMVAADTQG